jgi:U3 small nucleolar RNA-associated protein 12
VRANKISAKNSRWEHLKTFGIVASGTANVVWTPEPSSAAAASSRATGAGRAVVPANEEVLTWDIKKGDLLSRWSDPKNKSEVSVISQSRTDTDIFAVGYTDGSIRLWDSKTGTVVISFNGHKSAVSAFAWDHTGTRLASGGRDAHIIVWDLIAEVGLYRLRGHKDQITGLEFLRESQEEDEDMGDAAADGDAWILSTGKDTLIKLWDLSTQHCVETHVAHHGECWTMALMPDSRGCITAGQDGEMKVWSIDLEGLSSRASSDTDVIIDRGTLFRQIRDRAAMVKFHPSGNFFAVHGVDKNVEIWRIRNAEEVLKALKRKRKRKEQKGEPVEDEGLATATIGDIFVSYVVVRTAGKVKSVDWAVKPRSKASDLELLVSCTNNSLEFYTIEKQKEKKQAAVPEYNKLYSVELPGHRTDIRSVSLSTDDRMLASASNGSLKIWNVRTGTCIRTFECGYALCCSFLPGDKIVRPLRYNLCAVC